MKPILIIENSTEGLKINENASSPERKYRMGGIFTEFGVRNRNERIYSADEFVPHVYEMMSRKDQGGVIFGEFDHPDVFDISLKYTSHIIENCTYNKEANRVDGEIRLLTTHWGKEARALVDDGCPIFVSSRAAGVTEANGHVKLKKLFTYDIVADPGFASAKMSLNESFGYSNDTNFRILDMPTDSKMAQKTFDLSDTVKTNELFNMNKSDLVTKKQIADYSNYLTSEISKTLGVLTTQVKESANSAKAEEVSKLAEYYERLQEQQEAVVKYLDYLAEKVSVSISKGEKLEEKTDKIVEYSNYLAESLDKNIEYSNYLAENLDKNISYAEYLAENLDKNIAYAEYIAENLDKNIAYSEYIAENLDDSIKFSNYLAENLDKNIAYAEYIAENLDANIGYTEYLSENLDATIGYTEYITENLDSVINYTEYVAECADKTMSYANMISEKLNTSKEGGLITESIESAQEFLNGSKIVITIEKPEVEVIAENPAVAPVDAPAIDAPIMDAPIDLPVSTLPIPDEDVALNSAISEEEEVTAPAEEEKTETEEKQENTNETISNKIDKLIAEAKKREASKIEKPAFYAFLNSQDVETFESLTQDDQEKAIVAIKESVGYYSRHDVLSIISQAIEKEKPTSEQLLLNAMPEDIKPIWEKLDAKSKKTIIAQSKYYDVANNTILEHFWSTRKFPATESLNESRTLIEESNPYTQNERLSNDQIDYFTNKFKGLI